MPENPVKTLDGITVGAGLHMPPTIFHFHDDLSSFFFQPLHKSGYTRDGHQLVVTSHYRIDRRACYTVAVGSLRVTRHRHDGSEKMRISGSHVPVPPIEPPNR